MGWVGGWWVPTHYQVKLQLELRLSWAVTTTPVEVELGCDKNKSITIISQPFGLFQYFRLNFIDIFEVFGAVIFLLHSLSSFFLLTVSYTLHTITETLPYGLFQ